MAKTVTRRDVIGDLRRRVVEAVAGREPKTIMVSAAPGFGKTHLLQHLLDGIDATILRAAGDELVWRYPFGTASALLGVQLDYPPPPHADEILLAQVDRLCAAGTVVLVIDDAHHADAGTLSMLSRLSAAARDLPVVLLIAHRPLPVREQLVRLAAYERVHAVSLPALDAMDVDVLVHDEYGMWPGPRLQQALRASGGNPFHARQLLDDLDRRTALTRGKTVELVSGGSAVPAALDESVRAYLALLDGPARQLIDKLAVWGAAASVQDLAALDGSNPVALVGGVQSAIDTGVAYFDDAGRVAFQHEIYADVTYSVLAPTLRSILHTACADRLRSSGGSGAQVAHHLLAADRDAGRAAGTTVPQTVLDAVEGANRDLRAVPAMAVDLLGDGAAVLATEKLAVERAEAMLRSGQILRAEKLALSNLASATDPETLSQLNGILIFAMVTQGRIAEALELMDQALAVPLPPEVTAAIASEREWVSLLGAATAVPLEPSTDARPTQSAGALVVEAVRVYLLGNPRRAVEIAVSATTLHHTPQSAWDDGGTADIWPPMFELSNGGPRTAGELQDEAVQRKLAMGTQWIDAYQQFNAAGISMSLGLFDDASAQFDSALELAEQSRSAWISMAIGPRAMLEVYRGELPEAQKLLDAWALRQMPDQFGIPEPARARVALLEARRKPKEAVKLAHSSWDLARTKRCYVWLASVASEYARVAAAAQDHDFLAVICADLELLPRPLSPMMAAPVMLARALNAEHLRDAIELSLRATTVYEVAEYPVGESEAWEEAACAAAGLGHKDLAREYARKAVAIQDRLVMPTANARLHSRLRSAGVRLGASGGRKRPDTGWDSLTPTEAKVVDLIAAGSSGPEIGQQLFISPRTVQTHVSHALAKLGLRTRVELVSARSGQLPAQLSQKSPS